MKIWMIAAVLLVAACASVSDVVPAGGDSHMVSALGFGNNPSSIPKGNALQKADAYCKAGGAVLEVIDIKTIEFTFGRQASAEVTFRCKK